MNFTNKIYEISFNLLQELYFILFIFRVMRVRECVKMYVNQNRF